MKSNILGIDPGTRYTGWCLLSRNINTGKYQPLTGTLRTEDLPEMKEKISTLLLAHDNALVAIESFEHYAWLKTKDGKSRRIPTASNVGLIIGYVEGLTGDRFIGAFPARKTKANMEAVRKDFKNDHEYSAYCVAVYGQGMKRLKMKSGRE
jgi:hypothetical protein